VLTTQPRCPAKEYIYHHHHLLRQYYERIYKKHAGKLSRTLEKNIKINITKIERKRVDWIHLAQDRNHWPVLANMAVKLWHPGKADNLLTK
jgi:predicted transglutaminase-like protease